jgi:hypothetical protein
VMVTMPADTGFARQSSSPATAAIPKREGRAEIRIPDRWW